MYTYRDDRTNKGWPLPYGDNALYDDVERLREALNLIDANVTAVEENASTLGKAQESINTRLDVIVGQATEDMEILDARIDAKEVVHPNLGHNLRSIHAILVDLVDEFQGLLVQYSEIAHAQIQEEVNRLDFDERRKGDTQREVFERLVQGEALQQQIHEAVDAIFETVLNLRDIKERNKADLLREEDTRSATDEALQIEIASLADGLLNSLMDLSDILKRSKDALEREIRQQNEYDDILQSQVDENANAELENSAAIHSEAETRRKEVSEARGRIGNLESENEDRKSEIKSEISARQKLDEALDTEHYERVESDLGLATQADSNAEANLQNALNLTESERHHRAALTDEARERATEDENLQAQIDTNAEAELRNSFRILDEAEIQRKKFSEVNGHLSDIDDALHAEAQQRATEDLKLSGSIDSVKDDVATQGQGLSEEAQVRSEHDTELARQSDDNAEANLISSLNALESDKRRKADLLREVDARIAEDENLQLQVEENANAGLEISVAIHGEAEHRRTDVNAEIQKRIEHNDVLQFQVDENANATLENSAAIHQEADTRRKEVSEARVRIGNLESENVERKSEIQSEISARQELEESLDLAHSECVENDQGLATQADSNAEANLQNALNLAETEKHHRADLSREVDARIAEDENLQREVDSTANAGLENSIAIHNEAEQRRKSDEKIKALKLETDQRADIDEYHQFQIEKALHSILENSLALSESLERRRKALDHEILERVVQGEGLHAQIDSAATAGLENSLNLKREAEQRRKISEDLLEEKEDRERQIGNLHSEIDNLYEVPLPGLLERLASLQSQSDNNAEAATENSLSIHTEADQRRKDFAQANQALEAEILRRIEYNEIFQAQINYAVRAILEGSLLLMEAFGRRRHVLELERNVRVEEHVVLQEEVDTASVATLENTLNLVKFNEERRLEDASERNIRVGQDDGALSQIDALAETCMGIMLNNYDTRQKINKVAESASIDGTNFSDEAFDEVMSDLFS